MVFREHPGLFSPPKSRQELHMFVVGIFHVQAVSDTQQESTPQRSKTAAPATVSEVQEEAGPFRPLPSPAQQKKAAAGDRGTRR